MTKSFLHPSAGRRWIGWLLVWATCAIPVFSQEEADPRELGAQLFEQGDLPGALDAFERALAEDDDDTNLLFNSAVIAHRLGEQERALGHVEKAIIEEPKETRLHVLQSAILGALERPWEALAALERAGKLDPDDAQIQFRLGNLYFQQERKEDAIVAYQKAVKEDRKLIRAYYNLGTALAEVGRDAEAVDAYEVALKPIDEQFSKGEEVDPIHARAYLNLGGIFFRRQDWPSALDAYGKALQLDPQQSAALYNQGFILHKLQRYAEAETVYRRALELDPELPLAYLHLGEAQSRAGAPEQAISWLEKGLEMLDGEDRTLALTLLGRSYFALGDREPAERRYREALAVAPESFEALYAVARMARVRGAQDADDLLARARELRPNDPGVLLELAASARDAGDLDREAGFYEEALQRAPDLLAAKTALALTRLRQGRLQDAQKLLDTIDVERAVASATPRGAIAIRAVYALVQIASGRADEGAQALRAAAASQDAGPDVRAAAALLDARDGRLDAAIKVLEPMQNAGPALKQARAKALWLEGRGAAAEATLRGSQSLDAFVAIGEIALRSGDVRGAAVQFDRAASLCAEGASPRRPQIDGGRLRVDLGDGGTALCTRLPALRGVVQVRVALLELAEGRTRAARDAARAALQGSLGAAEEATARYVRGTAALMQGDASAAGDLEAALAGALPESLQATARNNLGVARLQAGRVDEARRALEAASADVPAAKLNLGVLIDDHQDSGQALKALELYEQYLAAGGARRSDVEAWAERLRKVHQ